VPGLNVAVLLIKLAGRLQIACFSNNEIKVTGMILTLCATAMTLPVGISIFMEGKSSDHQNEDHKKENPISGAPLRHVSILPAVSSFPKKRLPPTVSLKKPNLNTCKRPTIERKKMAIPNSLDTLGNPSRSIAPHQFVV
jgi:hypothetical protein